MSIALFIIPLCSLCLCAKNMAVAQEFTYFKPTTLDEALSLLSKYGENACVLAGGTDLAVKIKAGEETSDVVVDIKGIEELKKLTLDENGLHVGALISFSHLINSEIVKEKFPLLCDASATVASLGIRNRATMCGNLCSAVPSLDSGPTLLVHEAVALLKGKEGESRLPISEWFLGPKRSALKPGELLSSISVPLPEKNYAGAYVKLGRYSGEDLAQAGVGILVLEGNEYRVAFCAVGPVPGRAHKIEALLNGKELNDGLIEEAKALVPKEISPITDIRSSKEYRILMIKIMLERGLKAAVSRLRDENSEHGAILV